MTEEKWPLVKRDKHTSAGDDDDDDEW